MGWFWARDELDDLPEKQAPVADVELGSAVYVAVLALDYGEGTGLRIAWTIGGSKDWALGYVLSGTDDRAKVASWLVLKIPLASGTEARSAEIEEFGPKGDGPAPSGETPK